METTLGQGKKVSFQNWIHAFEISTYSIVQTNAYKGYELLLILTTFFSVEYNIRMKLLSPYSEPSPVPPLQSPKTPNEPLEAQTQQRLSAYITPTPRFRGINPAAKSIKLIKGECVRVKVGENMRLCRRKFI